MLSQSENRKLQHKDDMSYNKGKVHALSPSKNGLNQM